MPLHNAGAFCFPDPILYNLYMNNEDLKTLGEKIADGSASTVEIDSFVIELKDSVDAMSSYLEINN